MEGIRQALNLVDRDQLGNRAQLFRCRSRSQATFAPRVEAPVLLTNGRYDVVFHLHSQIEPYLELFDASREHKRLAPADAAHARLPFPFILEEGPTTGSTATWARSPDSSARHESSPR